MEQQLFIAGLPSAGKTSFLAALWHVVESNEVKGALRLVKLAGDSSYLNRIRSSWIDAEKLERTKVADQTNLRMLLAAPNGKEIELWIPDLSGEGFESQWTDRVASTEYTTFVRASVGGLLFVHPNVREEHLIAAVNDLVPKSPKSRPSTATAAAHQTEEPVQWNPRLAPTQVQLIDLLQFVVSIRSNQCSRLGVIVSAWDLMAGTQSPEDWIKSRLPLLYQFLSTRSDWFSTKYFGVSAQGGKLEDKKSLGAMRSKIVPSERIVVDDGDNRTHDITSPIKWVIDEKTGE